MKATGSEKDTNRSRKRAGNKKNHGINCRAKAGEINPEVTDGQTKVIDVYTNAIDTQIKAIGYQINAVDGHANVIDK